MKAKFYIINTKETLYLDVDNSFVVDNTILERLAELSLEKENDLSLHKKWEEFSISHELELDEMIRPLLIQKKLLKEGSTFQDIDMNIDGFEVSAQDILEENVILNYEIEIF